MSNPPTGPAPEFLALQTALAGRYSLERELGRGGMGIVFLAREVALDRMVALKLLPPEMAARPGLKERFLREARMAARLSHPNIVPIHTVDEVDGFVFFAMAYVDGGTLGDRIRERGPLTHSEAVRLLREVSWALGHAHLQGLVHRDVKPDNILLEQGTGRAMVTDFGIAVLAEDAGDESPTQVLGTAEFMSPEQATGAVVDARSDLYSLGCVGFYALSGRVPFTADTAQAILGMHVTQPAPRLATVAPAVPAPVATAVDRCLRKDPDQRFEGGEAFAAAIAPSQEATRDLPVPVRVFIKQSREWETVLSYCGFGLAWIVPILLFLIGFEAPGWIIAALLPLIAALLGVPVLSLVRAARRLLASGYTRSDATTAFLQDIERREEEYRFQVGERVTWTDRIARWVKFGGFGVAAYAFGMAWFTGNPFWGITTFGAFSVGVAGLLVQEIRARARGDVMGERYLKLWNSNLGKKLFDLAGIRLERVAPALGAGLHRPTEVVIGLEADRLFEELPRETRRTLEGLPETVAALEEDAKSMRRQVSELEAILAEIGDDDPTLPSAEERARVRAGVEATRDETRDKLRGAVAALETIRLGLLRLHAGGGTVESLTLELQTARGLSDDMEKLLEGHREVERILRERRETGAFSIITTDPGFAGA
ncbi:MAG TPA: serine/threonine-protein kinase [Longimicrobiales bacterium]